MAASNYEACLAFTLKYEGGNSDDPADPGGRTHRGVTQKTYDAYRAKHGALRQDVYAMPDAEMHEIYRTEYWDAVNGDSLRPGEDLCVFDFAVNSGPGRAKSFWKMAGGQQATGPDLIQRICEDRLSFLKSLRTWVHFGPGWAKRVAACQTVGLSMAEAHVEPVPTPTLPARVPIPGIPASTAGQVSAALNQLIAYQTAFRAAVPTPFDEAIASLEKLGAAPTLSLPSPSPATSPVAIIKGKLSMPPNIWTSIFGGGGILAAGVSVFVSIKNGTPIDPTQVTLLLGLVSTGIGLIKAKDANATGGTVPVTQEAVSRAKSPPVAPVA